VYDKSKLTDINR